MPITAMRAGAWPARGRCSAAGSAPSVPSAPSAPSAAPEAPEESEAPSPSASAESAASGPGPPGCAAAKLARISAFKAASSTAFHTVERPWHTAGTSIRPSRSAEAIRASSLRRNDRATEMALSGSWCRPAAVTRERENGVGATSRSFGPVAPSPRSLTKSGVAMISSAVYGDVPRMDMSRWPTTSSSRSRRKNQLRS